MKAGWSTDVPAIPGNCWARSPRCLISSYIGRNKGSNSSSTSPNSCKLRNIGAARGMSCARSWPHANDSQPITQMSGIELYCAAPLAGDDCSGQTSNGACMMSLDDFPNEINVSLGKDLFVCDQPTGSLRRETLAWFCVRLHAYPLYAAAAPHLPVNQAGFAEHPLPATLAR